MQYLYKNPLLSSAYLPPVEYFFAIANAPCATIDHSEKYQKQSYRTRCRIATANGMEELQVPVCHDHLYDFPISAVKIDYSTDWVHRHATAMISAYRNSPFFEYYWDDIYAILQSKPEFLVELNQLLLTKLLELFHVERPIKSTTEYVKSAPEDFRALISPKRKEAGLLEINNAEKTYYQVFSARNGFIPNLSAVDLLFNEGPQATDFLYLES